MSKVLSVSQTAAAGDVASPTPVAFDDLTKVAGFPYSFNLNRGSPIERIDFVGIDRIKGIRVTYRTVNGPVVEVHGQAPPQGAASIQLTDTEVLINVTGRAGVFNNVHSVLQLTFVSLNKETGGLAVHGPFGDKETDEPLFYAAGTILAFAGKATGNLLAAISFKQSSVPLDEFEL